MPVVARCPRCQGLLAGTGRRERCMRCGEMVVAVLRKLCSRCGRDVSVSPRLKNQAGEYFCQPCWLEICESQGKEPAYHCGECGGLFAGDEVFQEQTQYICKACFAARRDPGGQAVAVLSGLAAAEESPETAPTGFAPSPYTATVAARRSRQAKRDRKLLVLIFAGAVVLIVGFTVLLAWLKS